MATTPVGLPTETGLTGLLLKLFNESDLTTVVNNSGGGDSMAYEGSTGLAIADIDEALSGRHYAIVEDGDGDVWAEGWVTLADTTDFHEIGGYAYLPAVESQVSGITGIFSGITTLAGWLRLMLRSDSAVATDHATELAEINNDEGSGSGDYDNTTAAQEAISTTVQAARTIEISGGSTTVEGVLIVISEDDYNNADGAAFDFVSDAWPDLTGSTVTFRAKRRGRSTSTSSFFNPTTGDSTGDYAEVTMSKVDVGGAEQRIRLELTSEEADLLDGTYHIHIRAVLANTRKKTLLNAPQGMTVEAIVEDEDPA